MMSPEPDRNAFARAASYLSYRAAARWTAYAAGIGSALMLVALLVLLILFVDVVVHRGQLPDFRDLAADEQRTVLADWSDLSEANKKERLAELAPDRQKALLKVKDWNDLGDYSEE